MTRALLRLSLLQDSNKSNPMLKAQTDITQGMAKAMDELNAVLMFFQGIPQEAAKQKRESKDM